MPIILHYGYHPHKILLFTTIVQQKSETSYEFHQLDKSPIGHVSSSSSPKTADSTPSVPIPSYSASLALGPLEKCSWYWEGLSM